MSASRPPIVFAHANGFPAGSYAQLFAAWRAAGFAVHAVERIGHDPAYPVSGNWPQLRAEQIAFVEREVGEPAYLVGHSLGGYLSAMVASRRPELARGVVMLDSPVVGGWKARALQVAKATGVGERFSPGHVSKRRRRQWPSVEAAHAHFAAKRAFAAFAPGVLDDYLRAGLVADGDGVALAFDRAIETAIYNTLPHHLDRLLRLHPPGCPVAFVHGTASAEIRQAGLRATERIVGGRLSAIEGSHLFPLERPAETAAVVMRWLMAFGQSVQRAA